MGLWLQHPPPKPAVLIPTVRAWQHLHGSTSASPFAPNPLCSRVEQVHEHFFPELFTHESDREAKSPERGNGSVLRSGLQTEFMERTPEKNASVEPSTKDAIETVRLCASLLRSHPSIAAV
jgi:hypothetical protein